MGAAINLPSVRRDFFVRLVSHPTHLHDGVVEWKDTAFLAQQGGAPGGNVSEKRGETAFSSDISSAACLCGALKAVAIAVLLLPSVL